MELRPDVTERGLPHHLGVLHRRKLLLVVIPAMAVIGALGYSLRQPVVYQASTDVLFQQEPVTVADPNPDQMVLSKRLDPNRVMQNEVRLAASQLVRDRVLRSTGTSTSASVQNVRDSDVIIITASGSSPERAAANANAWAAAYVEESREQVQKQSSASLDAIGVQLEQIDNRLTVLDESLSNPATPESARAEVSGERQALTSQRDSWRQLQSLGQAENKLAAENRVQIINPAPPPASPIQPATVRNVLLALLVGVGLALVIAYAVDQIDEVIHDADDLERASGRPIVALVAGSAPRDHVRALDLNDPTLRSDHAEPAPMLADLPAGTDSKVLLVPVRSHAHKVRQNIVLLEGVGQTIVGVALLRPVGHDTSASTASSSPHSSRPAHDGVSTIR